MILLFLSMLQVPTATTDASCDSVVTTPQTSRRDATNPAGYSSKPITDLIFFPDLWINIMFAFYALCTFHVLGRLLSIAEETLAEFLSKATGTAVDWVQMPGMKVLTFSFIH